MTALAAWRLLLFFRIGSLFGGTLIGNNKRTHTNLHLSPNSRVPLALTYLPSRRFFNEQKRVRENGRGLSDGQV